MVCTEGNTNRECSFFGVGWWGLWALMDGREQKIGGGDVRAKASSWDDEWDKAKNDCKGTFFGLWKDGVLYIFSKW